MLENKCLLITGGTGSLGKVIIERVLSGELGEPGKIIVFSRDETKQHYMRTKYESLKNPTDETIYNNFKRKIEFRIGDIRDYTSVLSASRCADYIINAAALKQVPTCQYFPYEAVKTNIMGSENIVRAIEEHNLPINTVIGVSTDKACKPINVMGMTKAIQEHVFIQGNLRCRNTRFICTRYGNVLASRGSVIPLFHQQILSGIPVTVTTSDMTRFLLTLNEAVDLIIAAIKNGERGQIWVPRAPSSNIITIAKAMINNRNVEIKITGIRPGEKIHEIMISEEEVCRTSEFGNYYVIHPMLPELLSSNNFIPSRTEEYSSSENLLNTEQTRQLLTDKNLMPENTIDYV